MKSKIEIYNKKLNISYNNVRCFFMAYSDRELIARLVQCEAGGEGENGMKAIATVC